MGKIFANAEARTFLVTGASGFLGKEVVKYILSEGAKVIAMDRVIADQLIKLDNPNLSFLEADLTKEYEYPKEATDVIHAAGRVSDWGSYESFYEINVDATKKLMNLAKDAGVKNFLFISSIDIHGFFGHVEETEDGTYYPSKCFYPKTKRIAEDMVRAFNSEEMKTVCIRTCTVYGPGDTTVQGPIMDAILKVKWDLLQRSIFNFKSIYYRFSSRLCRALEFGTGGDAYNIVSGKN